MKEVLTIPFGPLQEVADDLQELATATFKTMSFYGIKTLSIEEDKTKEKRRKELFLTIHISVPAKGLNPYPSPASMTELSRELYQKMVDYYNDNRLGEQKILSIRIETSVRKKVIWREEFARAAYLY